MPASATPPMSRARLAALLLVAVLAVAGIVSAAAGVHFALSRSQDFQWSPERLLLRHVDPWRIALDGNPGNLLMGTQNPNYLPELYVLLVPFGFLSLHAANLAWAMCNVGFAVGSSILAARWYGLRGPLWTIGVTGAVLAAAPTRTSISNGQQDLLVLALWCAALLTGSHRRPIEAPRTGGLLLLGLSYLKYSFAPAIALLVLLREGLRTGLRKLPWTFVPPVAATLLVWLWIHQQHTPSTLLRQLTEPLAVAKAGYQPTGDPGQTLMDLLEFLLGGNLIATPRLTAICFAAAIALTLAVLLPALRWLQRSHLQNTADGFGWLLALTAVMSFAFYKHHPYDEVVFLFALCHTLRHRAQPAAWLALALIGNHWYLQRFWDARIPWSFAWAEIRLASFFLLIAAVYFTRPARETHTTTAARAIAPAREIAV